MLTASRLEELASSDDFNATAAALREYLTTLEDNERVNLMALVGMYDRHKLDDMVKQAEMMGNPQGALFTKVAAIIRRTQDAVGDLNALAAKVEAMTAEVTQNSEPPYELPVISFAGKPAYPVLAAMQKGYALKVTKVSGWAVVGRKPADNQYPTAELVAQLLAEHVVIPAPGQPWDNPRECYLSAIGWRGMGCMYTDKTSEIELRTYELCGKPEDNPTARYWRSVSAEWRARQARRMTTPGWDKYNEFTVTIPDKVTGDGVKTITVLFEPGRGKSQPSAPDYFEFFGDVNDKQYHQHSQSQGTLNKTVPQKAYEIIAPICAKYAAEKRVSDKAQKAAERLANRPQKPPEPPLKVVDDTDDADALARELGII